MENQETKWRMNLQLFAEDASDGEGDEPQDKGATAVRRRRIPRKRL